MFGRLYPASLEHTLASPLQPHLDSIAAPVVPPTANKFYDISIVYNQGDTEMCTGYSSAAMTTGMETPRWGPQMFDAPAIYTYANTHDGMGQPHQGSTVHAAMECLTTVGAALAKGWAPMPGEPGHLVDAQVMWATTIDTVLQYLYSQSCMVLGIDWYESMMTVDSQGFIRPVGNFAGGHAICCRGFNMTEKYLVLRNSWGPLWGCTVKADGTTVMQPGADAKVHFDDFPALMGNMGEAAAVVQSKLP